jgi:NADPH:quinone reductase-like Zn-dependent oxidoreductase
MRAFAVDRFGEDGTLRELPDPVPGPGELLVRVSVAGVNPVDWKIRDGQHGPKPFPLILGVDFAGVIEAAGSNVADFAVGERIFGAARAHGSYAERTVVPASSNEAPIAKIPDGFSDAVAAVLPIAGLTALATLARLDVPRGETLLIYGATGGVGAIAVQIAHARGIRVIGTARSGKQDALRALGADEVIVYDRDDVVATVKAAYPDGITGVIDLVNDSAGVKRLAEIVRKAGRIVSAIRSIDDAAWFGERGITAGNLAMGQTPQSSRAGLEELVALIEAGTVAVDVKAAHPLEEAGAVLAALKSGKISGNIVLNVAPRG